MIIMKRILIALTFLGVLAGILFVSTNAVKATYNECQGDCKEKKNCMFQYALANGLNPILENTGLITIKEADALVDKWLPHLKEHWDEWYSPQMYIWVNCDTETDYNKTGFEIDFRDCELTGGHFYKVERKLII